MTEGTFYQTHNKPQKNPDFQHDNDHLEKYRSHQFSELSHEIKFDAFVCD